MADETEKMAAYKAAKTYCMTTRVMLRHEFKAMEACADNGDIDGCRVHEAEFLKIERRLPRLYARLRKAFDEWKADEWARLATGAIPELSKLNLVGARTGHTNGSATMAASIMEDSSGRRFVVTSVGDIGGDKTHLDDIDRADAIYETFGIAVPKSKMDGDSRIQEEIGGVAVADFMADASVPQSQKDAVRKQFMDGLDVDCMLSNWTVVGESGDNSVVKGGRLFRTDNRAVMSWRATAGKKPSWNDGVDDFFEFWKNSNQQKVLGGAKVSVEDLARKALSRDWASATRSLSQSDRNALNGKLVNLKKITDYADKLRADDPGIGVDEMNDELEKFKNNGFQEPKSLKQVLSDPKNDKFRIPATSKDKLSVHKTMDGVSKAYNHANLSDNGSWQVIEKMNAEDGTDAVPQIAKTRKDFDSQIGPIAGFRTVVGTPSVPLDKQIADLKDGKFFIACTGGRVHGFGMYVNVCDISTGDIKDAESGSKSYGSYGEQNATFMIGTTKDFKWILERDVRKKAASLGWSAVNYSGGGKSVDLGVMARALGYDGILCDDIRGTRHTSYAVFLNRSKTVILEKQDLWT